MAGKPKMSSHNRKIVWQRDKVCQMCGGGGSRKNPLTIHHIKPRSKYPHLANDVNNCVLLCRRCHDNVHHIHNERPPKPSRRSPQRDRKNYNDKWGY